VTLIDHADVIFGEDVILVLYYNILPVVHAKLITRVSVGGYLCDVNGHPLFMKKIIIFFNKNHILHWLDDLTGVITLPELLPSHKFLHIY